MNKSGTNTFKETEDIASATECTGLMPALPDTIEEDKNLSSLYGIHSAERTGKRKKNK